MDEASALIPDRYEEMTKLEVVQENKSLQLQLENLLVSVATYISVLLL